MSDGRPAHEPRLGDARYAGGIMRKALTRRPGGAEPGGAEPGGAEPGRAEPGRTEPGRTGRRDPGVSHPEAVAIEICLRLLTIAPRTRAQLASALRRRRVPKTTAEQVLGRFTDAGLIDDAVFASAWVESRHHSRGLSRHVLAAELRRRGVGEDDLRDAISMLDPEQEAATARQLVNKRLAATRGQPARARVRHLAGVLARKGYPPALVFRVVREALEQEVTDEPGLNEPTGAWLDDSVERLLDELAEAGTNDQVDAEAEATRRVRG